MFCSGSSVTTPVPSRAAPEAGRLPATSLPHPVGFYLDNQENSGAREQVQLPAYNQNWTWGKVEVWGEETECSLLSLRPELFWPEQVLVR